MTRERIVKFVERKLAKKRLRKVCKACGELIERFDIYVRVGELDSITGEMDIGYYHEECWRKIPPKEVRFWQALS